MIIITGDVHQEDRDHWEQIKVGTETEVTKKYLEILKRNNLKCTLFLNGSCLDKEWHNVKYFLNYDVELGGHTYDNFGGPNIFKSFMNRKLYGTVYGSKKFQERDILKTMEAFSKRGIKIKSWRTHAFSGNECTFEILSSKGIGFVSDLLGDLQPFKKENIIHVPINIPSDQNTIAYGKLVPENRDPFASCVRGRIKPEEWLEIVKKRIIDNENKKKTSVLILHPATMAYVQEFKIFERLCLFLSQYKSIKISEVSIK